MIRDYPTLRSVVGLASSLTTGGVYNSFAPPWLWIIASSWLLAWRRYFETQLLDILLSSDYSIATSVAE